MMGTPPRFQAKTLRLAIFSDAVPGRNGVGTYYDDLVESVRPRLGRVELIAPPGGDSTRRSHGWSIRMPGDPTQSLFLPWPPDLRRRLLELRPHVVIAATPWLYGLSGVRLAREVGAALCVGYHTQFERLAEIYWGRGPTRLARPILGWWDRFVLRLGDRVLVNNRELGREAEAAGARGVELVRTPAPAAFSDTAPPFPPGEIRRVLFLGRLAPEKRLDLVMEAARRHPGLQFRVVGDGPLRTEIQEAAGDVPNLSWTEWVPRRRVLEILDECDLVVLPSRFETFGTAAYEGMLRRRLVLVSRGCGLTRWPRLRKGVAVLGEDESLDGALDRLADTPPAELQRLAEAGYRAATEIREETVTAWVRLLESVAGERG